MFKDLWDLLTETEQDCENLKDLFCLRQPSDKTLDILTDLWDGWRRQNKTVRILKTCETADGDRTRLWEFKDLWDGWRQTEQDCENLKTCETADGDRTRLWEFLKTCETSDVRQNKTVRI